jgi:spermidine/putrescine transport system substrate-binding protein
MRISFTLAMSGLVIGLLATSGCRKAAPRGHVDRDLSLLIWADYLSPDALEGFVKETGAKVSITEVDNSEQLKQLLESKPAGFDVIVADEKTMKELVDLRLLLELDKKGLGVSNGEIEPFLNSSIDPGNRFTSPYLWGLTVLAGKEEILKGVAPSWNLLWREDLKIALLDEPGDLMWVALLALGYDPAQATEEQINEAADRLDKRFPDITQSMEAQVPILDQLESGEVDLVMSYNGDALTLMARVPGIEVLVPREGAPLWLDSFAISRDAPNPDLAHRFIEYMSKPEISALSATELNYSSPNRSALPLIAPDLLANPALYPAADLIGKCSYVHFSPQTEKLVTRALFNLISGSRARKLALETEAKELSGHSQEGPTD